MKMGAIVCRNGEGLGKVVKFLERSKYCDSPQDSMIWECSDI